MHQKEDAEHKPPSYWHKERILNLSQTLKNIYFSILGDCSHLYCLLLSVRYLQKGKNQRIPLLDTGMGQA